MKKGLTIFLQVVVVVLGIGVLTLLLWEPQLEGRNVHATNFEIYFKDPFLALVYVGSIPFFIALWEAYKVLGYAGQNRVFSQPAVKALRTIKYCAIVIIGFVVVEEVFIMLNHGNDDAAGGIFMGVLITFGSIVTATVAAVFQKVLQNAVNMKSDNDLTV